MAPLMFFSIFIFASLHCHVAVASEKSKETIEGDGKFYVYSNRQGCVTVQSEQPCHTASKLRADFAISYHVYNKGVAKLISTVKFINNAGAECISALQKSFCATFTSKCFENGTLDYGDAKSACWKANMTCPRGAVQRMEDRCAATQNGKQALPKCVLPSKHISGSCAQPKYKMPEDYLRDYGRMSATFNETLCFERLTGVYPSSMKNGTLNGTRMFPDECVSTMMELSCRPLYCSTDERRLLVKHNWRDCINIVDSCFQSVMGNTEDDDQRKVILEFKQNYIAQCDIYTNSTTLEYLNGTPGYIHHMCNQPAFISLLVIYSLFRF